MKDSYSPVVTRFAPSPTGFLHIGGVRTALYAWLFARQNAGTFILRIEDTDKAREVTGSIEHIQQSLSWLGIDWDFGPDKPGPFGSCLQSDRLETYKKYVEQLIKKGLAYPDPYTQEEVDVFRAEAEATKRPFLFRDHRPESIMPWDGKTPVRFRVPEIKRYQWQDVVRGDLEAGEEALDDFIILKADGYPTYNFAHIIDDLEMGVTHVMRGEEFISSTPKFLSLYDALEIPYPTFVTLPPIMGPDGKKKLSKRDGAKDLLDYQADGYLPEAMANFLALIGWNPGGERELFNPKELLTAFSLEKIQKSGGAFNEDKLRWMNKEYLGTLPADQQLEYVLATVPEILSQQSADSPQRIERLLHELIERTHNQVELREAFSAGEYDWVFAEPKIDLALIAWKNDPSPRAAKPRLLHISALLEKVEFDTPENIKNALWDYASEVGRGEVLWPLRVALTGRERSPDPFMCCYTLQKEETLARVKSVCDKIQ